MQRRRSGLSEGEPPAGTGILIVVDGLAATRRLISYVVQMLGRRRAVRFCMVHLSSPAGIAESNRSARRAFASARTALRRAGVAARALDTQFFGPAGHHQTAARLLELANANRCCTVVIERPGVGAHDSATPPALVASLLRDATAVTIWLVA